MLMMVTDHLESERQAERQDTVYGLEQFQAIWTDSDSSIGFFFTKDTSENTGSESRGLNNKRQAPLGKYQNLIGRTLHTIPIFVLALYRVVYLERRSTSGRKYTKEKNPIWTEPLLLHTEIPDLIVYNCITHELQLLLLRTRSFSAANIWYNIITVINKTV